MKRYVLGDPHGSYRGLIQCLERSKFNKQKDELIVLGDVVDGWPESVEVIEELLTIPNMIAIMGNHDYWCYNWLRYGWAPEVWLKQGGDSTYNSYKNQENSDKIRDHHKQKYFDKCHAYYIDEHKNVFVHGGFTDINGLGNERLDTYMWDRSLWDKAKSAKKIQLNIVKNYNKVFIGHTSLGDTLPSKQGGNIWNLDTGGGWEGRLTIMDIETEEYWQSDKCSLLYPEVKGR